VVIYPYGMSPRTKTMSQSQCGFEAIENLLPFQTLL
jgi:hypothetical protein